MVPRLYKLQSSRSGSHADGGALNPIKYRKTGYAYERTKRSRLSHLGFLGLKVMNLLKRTWATGAMPIGAPG